MQVANTLNNTIRILFNPRVEKFKLFDFLVVKSDDSRYIAQVIEIYDDKFDASQNVAKIKLFYRITDNNEVMPYDNFTPNKECEILKVKPEEIEGFINQDKETFILGTNVKSNSALNLQYAFFDNNPVILADKIENANTITYNLAKKLSQKKNVVIIDTSGILELDGAKKIKANKNFRIPLNYSTIDHVFERCLQDASLEFQAIGSEIINEIKKFAKKQENKFIPFNLLTRVLIQQHKATPYPELKLLLTRLKKYQMDEIFAKTKNDKDALFKAIENNAIVIIDLSDIDSYWQRTYLDYIVTELEQEVYLTTRINDDSFGIELTNKIYSKKKNIKFIPNVSYSYKKLPTIMQYCENYVLMPSLTQRADFLDANFALSNLISDGCIIFGKNTDNFLYLASDYELEIQEKRKNYRKIALTMVQQDAQQNLGEKGDYFENKENDEISDSARLIKELSDFEASQQETLKAQEEAQYSESFDELEESSVNNENQIKIEENDAQDLVFNKTDEVASDSQIIKEADSIIGIEPEQQDNQIAENEIVEEFNDDKVSQEQEESLSIDDVSLDGLIADEEESKEINLQEIEIQEEQKEEVQSEEIEEDLVNSEDSEDSKDSEDSEDLDEMPSLDVTSEKSQEEDNQDVDLSDEELDFFQMAQESEAEYQDEDNNESDEDDDIDLSAIADNSLNDSFEEIINTKNQQNPQTITVDEKTKINADILEQGAQKENLPIFKDEQKAPDANMTYKVNDTIIHKKYGKGTIVKTIKYENRQLLQIEFVEAGKKLLDPKVADIKLEQ